MPYIKIYREESFLHIETYDKANMLAFTSIDLDHITEWGTIETLINNIVEENICEILSYSKGSTNGK